MVNVVLYKRKDNFHNIIVELVPSKELNWEISALTDAGYTGPPEPSEAIALQEGDQINFQFCGNISASGEHTFFYYNVISVDGLYVMCSVLNCELPPCFLHYKQNSDL